VPFKERFGVVRVQGAVYERAAQADNFYAREYDATAWQALLADSGLVAERQLYVSERAGLGAIDHWEWGPGRGSVLGRGLLLAKRVTEKLSRHSFDAALARRYLHVGRSPEPRLVNIVALLQAKDTAPS
jgi:hypothetical protein